MSFYYREYSQLVKDTAKELGLPEKQVNLIVSDFWNGIKYYMINAHLAKRGILINKFMKFEVRYWALKEYIDAALKRGSTGRAAYYKQIALNILATNKHSKKVKSIINKQLNVNKERKK